LKESKWSEIPEGTRDVKRLCDALEAHGFVVQTLTDIASADFAPAVERFIRQRGYEVNARILIYFGGHGVTRSFVTSSDESIQVGYVVPVDGVQVTDEKFVESAIRLSQFVEWASASEAKHVMFLFDSCMSGSIFDGMRGEESRAFRQPSPDYVYSTAANLKSREFITAGDATQLVPQKSIFLDFLIDALLGQAQGKRADANGDGFLTSGELAAHLKNWVPQAAAQTPQYGKLPNPSLSKGDMIFRLLGPAQVVSSASKADSGVTLTPLYIGGNGGGLVRAYRVETLVTTRNTGDCLSSCENADYEIGLGVPDNLPSDAIFSDVELACIGGICASTNVSEGPTVVDGSRRARAKLTAAGPSSTWRLSAKVFVNRATTPGTVFVANNVDGLFTSISAANAPILVDRPRENASADSRAAVAIKEFTPKLESDNRQIRYAARRDIAKLFKAQPELIADFVRGMPQGSYRYQLGVATALGSLPSWTSDESLASIKIIEGVRARVKEASMQEETTRAINKAVKPN
jgi:hypothetical protein